MWVSTSDYIQTSPCLLLFMQIGNIWIPFSRFFCEIQRKRLVSSWSGVVLVSTGNLVHPPPWLQGHIYLFHTVHGISGNPNRAICPDPHYSPSEAAPRSVDSSYKVNWIKRHTGCVITTVIVTFLFWLLNQLVKDGWQTLIYLFRTHFISLHMFQAKGQLLFKFSSRLRCSLQSSRVLRASTQI